MFEADCVEKLEMLTQPDVVGRHLYNRLERQPACLQDEADVPESIPKLSFRVVRHPSMCFTSCGAGQEDMLTGHDGRRHL